MFVAEHDLEDIDIEPELAPPPEADGTDRGRPVIEFLEESADRGSSSRLFRRLPACVGMTDVVVA
jgi:hypothetical protein